MAAFYFLLYHQEHVLSPVHFAISEAVPANGRRMVDAKGGSSPVSAAVGRDTSTAWPRSYWDPPWELLQRSEELLGGFADGTRGHLPEEQGGC